MTNYYLLSWKHTPELASAIYAIENQVAHELIPVLNGKNHLPFKFQLKRIKETKDGIITDGDLSLLKEVWLDYQPNNLAWPLMSESLKYVIESNLTGNEQIDWVECNVENGNEKRPYFILRFNKKLDVLDLQKTTFVEGTDHIIRPVFASSKIRAYSVFSKPSKYDLWKITSGIYVNDALKKAIQKAKLTGMVFSKSITS